MTDYQAARKRMQKINASGAGYGQAVLDVYGHESEGQFYTDLRTILAGPPEPSVEEVALVLFRANFTGLGWSDYNWPRDVRPDDRARIERDAKAVQALYRSKTND